MRGTQIDKSPIGTISETRKISMPTLMEEIKQVVLVKEEFEFRGELKLKGLLWNFPIIRILMQGRETNIF